MGEVNCHCRKTKALAVESQREIWAVGTFVYASRRLFIPAETGSTVAGYQFNHVRSSFLLGHTVYGWLWRSHRTRPLNKKEKNPCFKSQKHAHEAACGNSGECST